MHPLRSAAPLAGLLALGLLLAPPRPAPAGSTGVRAIALRGHSAPVLGLGFSPNGDFLASASADGTARVWNVSTKRSAYTLRGHSGAVTAVAFAPNGETLFTGGADRQIRRWEFATGKQQESRSLYHPVTCAAAASRHFVAFGMANGQAAIWDLRGAFTLTPERRAASPTVRVGWAAGGKRLVTWSADGRVQVWKVGMAQVKAAEGSHGAGDDLSSLGATPFALNPDRNVIALAGPAGGATLVFQRWPSRQPLGQVRPSGEFPALNHLAFSPNGQTLAGAGQDGGVFLWDVGARLRGEAPTAQAPNRDFIRAEAARWPALTQQLRGSYAVRVTNEHSGVLRFALRRVVGGQISGEGADGTVDGEDEETIALPEGDYAFFYRLLLEPGVIYRAEGLVPLREPSQVGVGPNSKRVFDHYSIVLGGAGGNSRAVKLR
jgi:hypothetical protein